MRRWWVALWMVVALCGVSGSARAQVAPPDDGQDYGLEGEGWSGLSNLFVLAKGEGITLLPQTTLDYSRLSLSEPVIIIYPSEALRADSLTRFVADGGRMLIADDFGQSDELLQRLELTRITPATGALPHDEFLYDNPALPILRPTGVHPMLEGVSAVVANHPSILTNIGGPVVSYSEDGGLIYDMNLGSGKVIVSADASLLINHMVLVADNGQLIRNTLRYLCQGQAEGCTIQLYVGGFEQRGSWGDLGGLGATREDVARDMGRWNDALKRAMEQLPAERLFYYLAVLLTLGVIIYLYTIFPVRRPKPHSDALREAQRPGSIPQSEFDWSLARYLQGSAGMNYAQPVAILKEVFEELFLTELELWVAEVQLSKLDPGELSERYAARFLREASPEQVRRQTQQLVELLTTLARVPTRHRVFLDNDVYFSERDLLRLHARCMEILDLMKLREDYERRTRHDI
jgi:hypothetical protein